MNGPPLHRFRGVVFDLDGTLLDSMPDIMRVGNSLLSQHGLAAKSREEYGAAVGMGMETLYARLTGDSGNPSLVEELVRKASLSFERTDEYIGAPYPGIMEMLDSLAKEGAIMGILSNKPQRAVEFCVELYFPDVPFVSVVGAEPGKPVKPLGPGAELLMETMGVGPETTLMVGDGEPDVLVALRTGMFPVACSWGFTPVEMLVSAGARFVAGSPDGVVDLFRSGVR